MHALEKWILGLPSMVHSDSGREFVSHLIEEVLATSMSLQLVNGRPRHSQSLLHVPVYVQFR